MKKMFLVFGLGLLVSTASFAQKALGFKIGANAAQVNKFDLIENITPDLKLAPALGGGVFGEIHLSPAISLQSEINFVQKGFKVAEGFDLSKDLVGVDIPLSASVKMKLRYLQIPILLKLKNSRGTYVSFGPSVGYLSQTGLRINVLNIFPLKTPFPKAPFKELDLSGILNLGTEQKLTEKLSFIMEARYEHSLSRLLNTPLIDLPVRSQNMGLNAGLKIQI